MTEDGLAFVFGREVLRVRTAPQWASAAAARLRAGIGADELSGDPRLCRLVAQLRSLGWLRQGEDEPRTPARLDRQVGYLSLFGPDTGRMLRRIADATVVLLGTGGIGVVAAQHLAAAGVGTLVLVDPDVVQEHNLNRQLAFTLEDEGEAKVSALARRLTLLAPEVRVKTIREFVQEPQDLNEAGPADVLLLGADHPHDIDRIAWSWCVDTGTAYVRAAVGHEHGYWGPLLTPSAGHCLFCFDEQLLASVTDGERCLAAALREPTPWSFGPTNTIVAAWAAHDVLQYLCGSVPASRGARMSVDFSTCRVSRFAAVEPPMGECTHSSRRVGRTEQR